MGFIRRPPRQAGMKRFLMAFDEIDMDIFTHFSSVREFLKDHVKTRALAAESRRVIVQLIGDGVDPKITVYLFIRVLLEDLLLDGEHHALQGKLTPDGENFLAVYNNVVRELQRLNWFSAGQATEHFEAIRHGVAGTAPA